jgi:hypothetical protein
MPAAEGPPPPLRAAKSANSNPSEYKDMTLKHKTYIDERFGQKRILLLEEDV